MLGNGILGIVGLIILFASSSYGATITGTLKGPDGAPFEGAFVQATECEERK